MIAGGLRSGSERGAAWSGASARAEFYADKKRTFAAFRRVHNYFGLAARTASVTKPGMIFRQADLFYLHLQPCVVFARASLAVRV